MKYTKQTCTHPLVWFKTCWSVLWSVKPNFQLTCMLHKVDTILWRNLSTCRMAIHNCPVQTSCSVPSWEYSSSCFASPCHSSVVMTDLLGCHWLRWQQLKVQQGLLGWQVCCQQQQLTDHPPSVSVAALPAWGLLQCLLGPGLHPAKFNINMELKSLSTPV